MPDFSNIYRGLKEKLCAKNFTPCQVVSHLYEGNKKTFTASMGLNNFPNVCFLNDRTHARFAHF